MANTYTQIYIHYVIATKHRMRFITPDIQKEIHAYAAGLIKELNCFLQCIGGMDDHIHILVGLHPTMSISEFAQKFKANTSRFINDKGWAMGKFSWQDGFGAFSISQSALDRVRDYITHQEEHHIDRTFQDEYEALLTRYRIKFDKSYVFHDLSD